jgi:hypothetical protein
MNSVTTIVPDVEKIADTILDIGWQHVVISGGEPLLYPKECEMLIDFIRPYVKDITLFTSLPSTLDSEDGYLQFRRIISRLDGTNISVRHYDTIASEKIARSSKQFDWKTTFIRRLAREGLADKFRISLELCKDYLDTEEKVKWCLLNFYAMGVKNIKLSELNAFPELFVPVTKVLPIKFDDSIIWSGCSIKVKDIPQWCLPGLLKCGRTLLVKRTCAMIQPCHKYTKKDRLKLRFRKLKDKLIPRYNYRIILPNGELTSQW